MNTNIKKLIAKSNVDIRGHYDESGNTPAELQGFAKLIIKECVDIALQNNNSGEGEIIAETIAKHFSLEQY